jgi:hypothetical protein
MEHIKTEVITADKICACSREIQEKLIGELEGLFLSCFPHISKAFLNVYVQDYFIQPPGKLLRQAMMLRDDTGRLIASNICDYGNCEYQGDMVKAIYSINTAIIPEYQTGGMGKTIAIKLFTGLQPDVYLTTCVQSAALHSRINLVKKGLLKGFEVYPRLEQREGKDFLVTVPYEELDFVVTVFKQVYFGVAEGKPENIDGALRNLTVFMARKNIHGDLYDFHPWEKGGRKDKLAAALGLTDRDGILVMFRKKAEIS